MFSVAELEQVSISLDECSTHTVTPASLWTHWKQTLSGSDTIFLIRVPLSLISSPLTPLRIELQLSHKEHTFFTFPSLLQWHSNRSNTNFWISLVIVGNSVFCSWIETSFDPHSPPPFLLSLKLPLLPLGTECGAAVKDSTSDTKKRPRDLCVS